MTNRKSEFPPGWDEKRVKSLIDHYDNQSDEEAIAEFEAAYEDAKSTMMQIPIELVPEVENLIAENSKSEAK